MPVELGKFQPTDQSRMGRMLQAGRITVTMRSKRSGEHITLTMQCLAKVENKWEHTPFAEATHVFITQGPGGFQSAKVGTYYPKTGKLYLNKGFETKPWEYAVTQTFVASVTGVQETDAFTLLEADLCGRCGRELTDPVSIERGIGPTCLGAETGSKHYRKSEHEDDPVTTNQERVARRVLETNDVMNAVLGGPSREEAKRILDRKGREVPRTFAALAAQVKR